MKTSEIIAAKRAFARMHPDEVVHIQIHSVGGNSKDRRRRARQLIRQHYPANISLGRYVATYNGARSLQALIYTRY